MAAGDVTQLAFYQDVLVGAVACRHEQPKGGAEGKGKLYIMTLGVLPPYRGRGVGRQLLAHTLEEARKQDKAAEIYLHVQTNNDDALNFYKYEPALRRPDACPAPLTSRPRSHPLVASSLPLPTAGRTNCRQL